ncbi:hypothetical protein ACQP00_21745 [Dactylosporangium sp. CS-047395]|uniref:hypothetical protein n=1 Tax=Dactylosporangium sp. CS-047395 TaxID=3239936 RepID=UPI003D8DDD02
MERRLYDLHEQRLLRPEEVRDQTGSTPAACAIARTDVRSTPTSANCRRAAARIASSPRPRDVARGAAVAATARDTRLRRPVPVAIIGITIAAAATATIVIVGFRGRHR